MPELMPECKMKATTYLQLVSTEVNFEPLIVLLPHIQHLDCCWILFLRSSLLVLYKMFFSRAFSCSSPCSSVNPIVSKKETNLFSFSVTQCSRQYPNYFYFSFCFCVLSVQYFLQMFTVTQTHTVTTVT